MKLIIFLGLCVVLVSGAPSADRNNVNDNLDDWRQRSQFNFNQGFDRNNFNDNSDDWRQRSQSNYNRGMNRNDLNDNSLFNRGMNRNDLNDNSLFNRGMNRNDFNDNLDDWRQRSSYNFNRGMNRNDLSDISLFNRGMNRNDFNDNSLFNRGMNRNDFNDNLDDWRQRSAYNFNRGMNRNDVNDNSVFNRGMNSFKERINNAESVRNENNGRSSNNDHLDSFSLNNDWRNLSTKQLRRILENLFSEIYNSSCFQAIEKQINSGDEDLLKSAMKNSGRLMPAKRKIVLNKRNPKQLHKKTTLLRFDEAGPWGRSRDYSRFANDERNKDYGSDEGLDEDNE